MMTKKQIALNAVEALRKEYPDAICSLTADTPFELLIAMPIKAVNIATIIMFAIALDFFIF